MCWIEPVVRLAQSVEHSANVTAVVGSSPAAADLFPPMLLYYLLPKVIPSTGSTKQMKSREGEIWFGYEQIKKMGRKMNE